jgi:hypothetical protein
MIQVPLATDTGPVQQTSTVSRPLISVTNTASSKDQMPSLISMEPAIVEQTSAVSQPLSKRINIGAIAGGVVGGLLALFCALLFIFWRKKSRGRIINKDTAKSIDPFVKGPDETDQENMTSYVYNRPYVRVLLFICTFNQRILIKDPNDPSTLPVHSSPETFQSVPRTPSNTQAMSTASQDTYFTQMQSYVTA